LAKIFKEDSSVFADMTKIFDLLIQQRHEDGTNSGTFINRAHNNINNYLNQNKELIDKDPNYSIACIKYGYSEIKNMFNAYYMDSEIWMNAFIAALKNPDLENSFLQILKDIYNHDFKDRRESKKSILPEISWRDYVLFLEGFFKTKKNELKE